MGGSNVLQAFPNYLICLRFIRITTVVSVVAISNGVVAMTSLWTLCQELQGANNVGEQQYRTLLMLVCRALL